MIRKVGPGRYVLKSRETGRILGHHRSYAAAARQERAINISKARAHGYHIPYRPARAHPFAHRRHLRTHGVRSR